MKIILTLSLISTLILSDSFADSDVPERRDLSPGSSKTQRSIDLDLLVYQPTTTTTYAEVDAISSNFPDAGGKKVLSWVEGGLAASFGAAISSLTSELVTESSKGGLLAYVAESVDSMDTRILFVEAEAEKLPGRLDDMTEYRLRYEEHLHTAITIHMYHLGFYSEKGLLDFAEYCFGRLAGYGDPEGLTLREKWRLAFDCCETLRETFSEEGVPFEQDQVISLAERFVNNVYCTEQCGGSYGRPLSFGEPDQDNALPADLAVFVRRLAHYLNVCVEVNYECCHVHELISSDSYHRSAVWNADDEGTGKKLRILILLVTASRSLKLCPQFRVEDVQSIF